MLSQAAQERQLAAAERCELRRKDALSHHGLGPAELLPWVAVLAGRKGLKRAWLARREVRYLQAVPAYVLMVQFKALSWVSASTLEAVASSLPEDVSCLVLNKAAHGAAWRQFRKVEKSLIFPVEI